MVGIPAYPMIIDGQLVTTDRTVEVVNPATGAVFASTAGPTRRRSMRRSVPRAARFRRDPRRRSRTGSP